ncbi:MULTISPECIES: DUF1294 domain-containing protein [Myroides]|uniref:DUF1294 domain-containing protein n=1 Tax=Myroides albus TaxID=2562892 RepID=A0A6I3LHE2_9FLAO|nr:MULTISPECIES: DUF1294 domain-containing protein [Myroides]MTG96560.1 DUF1294 domain-containing protein [Myroides albus]MVX34556.1 DUF1294 domain-containing protein [Myroides sp. LoEW2-1]UVD81026.1 DUF1294 domain-containing protein [Myroides albus]
MKFLFLYLFIINYLAFSMFAYDKEQALKNRRRVAEKNLLTLCFFGGTLGAWIAMKKLRHKISKDAFKVKFYAILAIQVAVFFILFKR